MKNYKKYFLIYFLNLITMKKVKLLIIMLFAAMCITACGSMSNMSYEDAYDIGYGLGRATYYMTH